MLASTSGKRSLRNPSFLNRNYPPDLLNQRPSQKYPSLSYRASWQPRRSYCVWTGFIRPEAQESRNQAICFLFQLPQFLRTIMLITDRCRSVWRGWLSSHVLPNNAMELVSRNMIPAVIWTAQSEESRGYWKNSSFYAKNEKLENKCSSSPEPNAVLPGVFMI